MGVSRTAVLAVFAVCVTASAADRPNVIVMITDDQGYGDFGATGNRVIATPNLDAMAARSVSMNTFYVSPVCSPTRASLMTGRYNYRTRCIDTFVGRSMMEPDEVTLAEVLRGAGYATGIFGKWHLGDCYPMRAMDQGFEESLVLRGGGIGQPSDPAGAEGRYTDPVLFHNGAPVTAKGYCTDIFFDAAAEWIAKSRDAGRLFFAYIATNAPHSPYDDVPEASRARYEQADLASLSAKPGAPAPRELTAIAAMITNIDDNVGRLFARLDALGITDNTLVIFMDDNGPNTARYVGLFRGMKSDVLEGGVRSPLWMQWRGRLEPGFSRDEAVAHIDVMPTILEACGVAAPAGVRLDGRSFWRLATGEPEEWPERPIVIQTHRSDVPVRFHHFMIREGRWKLLHASGFGRETFTGEPRFELYDVVSDPGESTNRIDEESEIAARLRASYENWFDDVSSTRPDNYAPPRIHIGTAHEDMTVLTRQDWRGGTWAPDSIGHWLVTAEYAKYDALIRFVPRDEPGIVELRVGNASARLDIEENAETCLFEALDVSGGDAEVRAVIRHGDRERGVHQVELRRK